MRGSAALVWLERSPRNLGKHAGLLGRTFRGSRKDELNPRRADRRGFAVPPPLRNQARASVSPLKLRRNGSTLLLCSAASAVEQHKKLEDFTMNIRLLVAGILAGAIVSSPAFAQDKASQKFLKEAIEGNLAEVQMGQLAEKNGKSDGVRSFGQMLQKDHSEANQKATAAANQMGMSPPSEPNSKQKAMYDKMSKLSGDKFDREFAKHMVTDHKKDIKEYENEAKRDDAAGTYAKEALPTL